MFEHFFDANSPFAGLVYCRWPMPLHGLAAAGPFRWECFLRRTPLTGLLGITPRACQMSALQTQLQAASAHRPATRSNPGMVTAHGSARRTGAAAHSNLRGKVSTKLLDQERELSRRKPSLLCLRLKSAKQGCFHPRDVLPGRWANGEPDECGTPGWFCSLSFIVGIAAFARETSTHRAKKLCRKPRRRNSRPRLAAASCRPLALR